MSTSLHIMNIKSLLLPVYVEEVISSVTDTSIDGTSSLDRILILESVFKKITYEWLWSVGSYVLDPVKELVSSTIPISIKIAVFKLLDHELLVKVPNKRIDFGLFIHGENLHITLEISGVRNN